MDTKMRPQTVPPVVPIHLVRHAQASRARPGETDFDRVLDGTGRADIARMAADIRARGWRLGTLFASPALRCTETAHALAAADPSAVLTMLPDLYTGPMSFYRSLIDQARQDAPLTIVGHNPMIEDLAWALLGEDAAREALPGGYPPGAVLRIARGDAEGFPARLLDCLVP